MRRIAIMTALACALIPASASARGGLPWDDAVAGLERVSYVGKIDAPGRPGITVRVAIGRGGAPRYLLNMRSEPIEASCADGSRRSGRIKGEPIPFPIYPHGYFNAQGPAGNGLAYTLYAHVHPQKARGHLRVSGHGCKSGNLRWHARPLED
jgi:hypothetical protein